MEKPPNIIINLDIDSLVHDIFEQYFIDAYENNTYTPRSLNKTVHKLHHITRNRHHPFKDDTIDGIEYLYRLMYDSVCKNCDGRVIIWFYKLAKKWLGGDEPPKFKKCICR